MSQEMSNSNKNHLSKWMMTKGKGYIGDDVRIYGKEKVQHDGKTYNSKHILENRLENANAEKYNKERNAKDPVTIFGEALGKTIRKMEDKITNFEQTMRNQCPRDCSYLAKSKFEQKVHEAAGKMWDFISKARELVNQHEKHHEGRGIDGQLCSYVNQLCLPIMELLETSNLLFVEPRSFQKNMKDSIELIEKALENSPDAVRKTNIGRQFVGVLTALLSIFAIFYDVARLVYYVIKEGRHLDVQLKRDSAVYQCLNYTYKMFHSPAHAPYEKVRDLLNIMQELHNYAMKKDNQFKI